MVSKCLSIMKPELGLPKLSRERFTSIRISLRILPIKDRNKFKIHQLTHKAIQCREPLYLSESLDLKESSTINLRSNHDTWKVVEHSVPGSGFTILGV